jgi:hypothetical protein
MQQNLYVGYSVVRSGSLFSTAVCSHCVWHLQFAWRCASGAAIAAQHMGNIPLPLDCSCIVGKQHEMDVQEDRSVYRTPEEPELLKTHKIKRILYKAVYKSLALGKRQVCSPAS